MPIFRSVVSIASPSLGGNGSNTWHARTDDALPTGDAGQLSGWLTALEGFYTAMQAWFAGGSVITHDGVWTRVDGGDDESLDAGGFTVGPTSGSTPLAPQDCLVVGWRAASGGRSGRGRTFLGPLSVTALESNGTPAEAARSAAADAAATLIEFNDDPANGSLVVWSEHDSLGRDIVSAHVRNVFGTLRSRRD